MDIRQYKTTAERKRAVEHELGIKLANIGTFTLDEQIASTKNCENMIGVVQIPLGLAGPVLINGEHANGNFFLPLATTEGALIASVARGCKAITHSGGAAVSVYQAGQTRGPVFEVKSLVERNKLYTWITDNENKLKQAAQRTSNHLTVKKIMMQSVAHYLFVRFSFDTGDAMGMNMATIAAEAMAEVIEKETGAHCLAIAGNFDIDKKPAWLNSIANRGFCVWAEAVIPKTVLQEVVKTTAQKFFEVWLGKCMIGSAMSGSLGFNAQYANIIAALFIATGQDPAHVVEGSMGITTAKVLPNGDLYVSIYLPSLIIGTVGGGTNLATQQEALQILGVSGKGNVRKFAEIIGTAVLAGELSLLASLAQGSLGQAHERLGRGKTK
jgi:hydroxymethylglutaryl-CoA reductase (NADPH)